MSIEKTTGRALRFKRRHVAIKTLQDARAVLKESPNFVVHRANAPGPSSALDRVALRKWITNSQTPPHYIALEEWLKIQPGSTRRAVKRGSFQLPGYVVPA